MDPAATSKLSDIFRAPLCKPEIDSSNLRWSNVIISEWKDKCSFLFSIVNFSKVQKEVGKAIKSPIFTFEKNIAIRWYLEVYSGGAYEDCKDHITVYLCNANCGRVATEVHYSICLINCKNEKVNSCAPEKKTLFSPRKRRGYKTFIKLETLYQCKETLLPEDRLHILCSIWYPHDDSYETFSGRTEIQNLKTILKPVSLLKELLADESMKDFTFNVNGQHIKVHKCVLAIRSSVFAAMLQHNMKEKNENVLEITDASFEVIKEMVHFIYTNQVASTDIVEELLPVAEKYGLTELKEFCKQYLIDSLNLENVLRLFELSDLFNLASLKIECKNFIIKQKDQVKKTYGYKNLVKRNPALILEMFNLLDEDEENEPYKKRVRSNNFS